MARTSQTDHRYVKKETLLLAVFVALIAGFIGGVVFSAFKGQAPGGPQAPTPAPATRGAPEPGLQDRIASLERLVSVNPEDGEAWAALGNLYFDTEQVPKAIEAYRKALDLNPDNADVWTDLGIMYRRNGQPREAVSAFDRAIEIDPLHEPSRFNKGVVLMHDLEDRPGAVKTWEALVKLNPQARAPNGQSVQELIEIIRKQ